jgi:hypothetical protein
LKVEVAREHREKNQMENIIPSKTNTVLSQCARSCAGFGLLTVGLWAALQLNQAAAAQEVGTLVTACWIAMNISALVALYFGARGFLVYLWPAKFAKVSSAWDMKVATVLEKHLPGARVSLFGREKWLVTDIASGKTIAELCSFDALRQFMASPLCGRYETENQFSAKAENAVATRSRGIVLSKWASGSEGHLKVMASAFVNALIFAVILSVIAAIGFAVFKVSGK